MLIDILPRLKAEEDVKTAMLKDLEELWMRDNLIETLRDCANALGELLPRDHAYRKIVDQANRLLDRHEQASEEQRATVVHMDTGREYKSAGEQEAPFKCKYCGQPSWIDPSDQSPPPDYCHEIDHGTAEDRTGS